MANDTTGVSKPKVLMLCLTAIIASAFITNKMNEGRIAHAEFNALRPLGFIGCENGHLHIRNIMLGKTGGWEVLRLPSDDEENPCEKVQP